MKVLSNKKYNEKGKLVNSLKNEYNESKQLIRTSNFDHNETLKSYDCYKYDSNGNCIQHHFLDQDGNLLQITEKEYDSKGRVIKITSSDCLYILEWDEYQYPDKNTTIHITKNDEGEIVSKTIHHHESNIEEHFDQYDQLEYEILIHLDSNDNVIKRELTKGNVTPKLSEYKYSLENGIAYEKLYVDGKFIRNDGRKYDSEGRTILFIQKDRDDHIISTLNLEYDKYGNTVFSKYTLPHKEPKIHRFIIKYVELD